MARSRILVELKFLVRILTKKKKFPLSYDMYRLQKNINKKTKSNHKKVLNFVNNINIENEDVSDASNKIVKYGYEKKQELLNSFKNKYSDNKIKVLVHIPTENVAVSGVSALRNMVHGLRHLGICAEEVSITENFDKKFSEFRPNIFISADTKYFRKSINIETIRKHKKSHDLTVIFGLDAKYSPEEYIESKKYWESIGVDILSSFNCTEYINKVFDCAIKDGYKIISLEFGANPLIHYPVDVAEKDLDYVFLASVNKSKWNRYLKYFSSIFPNHAGFINGPGWLGFDGSINFKLDRYIYSKTKIGLNLSIDSQINYERELNERTYQLAACGIPQLIDNPKLLTKRFSADSMFIAKDEKEYNELFQYILDNPQEAEKRALKALEEVLEKHTIFHRVEKMLQDINKI